MNTYLCPACHGKKTITFFTVPENCSVIGVLTNADMELKTEPCEACNGTGEISEAVHLELEDFRQDMKKLFAEILDA